MDHLGGQAFKRGRRRDQMPEDRHNGTPFVVDVREWFASRVVVAEVATRSVRRPRGPSIGRNKRESKVTQGVSVNGRRPAGLIRRAFDEWEVVRSNGTAAPITLNCSTAESTRGDA